MTVRQELRASWALLTRVEIVTNAKGWFTVLEKRGDRILVNHGTYKKQFVANQVARDVESMRRITK